MDQAREQRVGQVLVVWESRGPPTTAGVPLLRLTTQTALLDADGALRWLAPKEQRRESPWRPTSFGGDVVHRVLNALDDVLFGRA